MIKQRTSTRKIDEAVARSTDFELSIMDLVGRSERRAWRAAFVASGVALILAGGYFYLLPLNQKVPYIVMADAYAGTSTVARLTDDFTHHRISTSEAINRSNVAHFVLARESYDLAMLNLHDWATVQTMSAPGVKAAYTALYSSANPDNLVKTYGRETAIRVRLLSIVLIGNGPGVAPKGATVRLQRSLYDKQSGVTRPLDNKIATLEFSYKPNLQMDDQNRIANPLGFWVTSYRVDNDYASSPAAEVPPQPRPAADTAPSPAPATPESADAAAGTAPVSSPAVRPAVLEQPPTARGIVLPAAPPTPAARNVTPRVGQR